MEERMRQGRLWVKAGAFPGVVAREAEEGSPMAAAMPVRALAGAPVLALAVASVKDERSPRL